jgi:hypothetical protein
MAIPKTDMTMTAFARLCLLCLTIPALCLAEESLNGSINDDTIVGTVKDDRIEGGAGDDQLRGGTGDDELLGGTGDDELRGGSGDDTLIGGSGFDILFGGSGSDRFIIDIAADAPDEIMDFRPEDGDTILLRFRRAPESRLGEYEIKNVLLDARGEVTVQLINEDQFRVVKLRRSDLTLRVDDYGQDVRLIFTKKLE